MMCRGVWGCLLSGVYVLVGCVREEVGLWGGVFLRRGGVG